MNLSNYILRVAAEEGADIVDGDMEQPDAGFLRGPGDVGREEGIGLTQKGIRRLWGFLRQHVSTEGGQPTFSQCIGHSLIVDQWSSSCIDEDG